MWKPRDNPLKSVFSNFVILTTIIGDWENVYHFLLLFPNSRIVYSISGSLVFSIVGFACPMYMRSK